MYKENSIKNENIINFFDRLADGWDEYTHHDIKKIENILSTAKVTCVNKVADIACGTGIMFNSLLALGASEIWGIDISPNMIEKAQNKFNDKRINLFAGDIFDFEEKNFDLVTIYSAYPHFQNKEALCNYVYDMLLDGGRFIIAHSQSKEAINSKHNDKEVTEVSVHLHSAVKEAEVWQTKFNIDTLVDNDDIYTISGTKA